MNMMRMGLSVLCLLALAAGRNVALGQDAPAAPAATEVRLYSADIHDAADAGSGGGQAAITIAATRNGGFSGKVALAADGTIVGVRATMSELRQGDATILAPAVAVRYGVPWPLTIGSWYRPAGCDILLETPPAQVEPDRTKRAHVDVWVTVTVPKTARPGTYTGTLTVAAKGLAPTAVPVTLTVQDWALPDTQDFRTWIELIETPDNLAAEYGLPLWSDRHWEMIGKSLKLIGLTGSRVVYVPLICNTNFGHGQTMVRWIAKGDNKYEHDFSVMEKYLDEAERNMGRPKIVVFYVWEVFMNPPKQEFMTKIKAKGSREVPMFEARAAHAGKGPPVTVLDTASGKTETVFLPPYEAPESKALWQPLWDELRSRMKKRGLEKTMMLGVSSDWWPSEEQVQALAEYSDGLDWASTTHHTGWLPAQIKTGKGALFGAATIRYIAAALEFQVTINPAKERTYGWKIPILYGQFWRGNYYNRFPYSTVRNEAQCNITGLQRGLAHIGGDTWYSLKDKRGRRAGNVSELYPQSYWHSLNLHSWLLGAGPDSPVGTARLEVFREGVQECEARIAIESALTDAALRAKLGDDLARRAQDHLDDIQRACWRSKGATDEDFQKYGHVKSYRTFEYDIAKKWDREAGNKWFIASGWADRTARLYALAAEVENKLKN